MRGFSMGTLGTLLAVLLATSTEEKRGCVTAGGKFQRLTGRLNLDLAVAEAGDRRRQVPEP